MFSSLSPYYPRGVVRYIDNDKPLVTEVSESEGDGSSDSDDGAGPDVVHPTDMENNLANMTLCASLCNMATIHKNKEGNWQANGDATEIALQVFAHKLGRGKPHMTHARKSPHGAKPPSQPMQRTSSTYSANEKAVPLDGHYKLVIEHPFDSTVKRMSTAWRFIKDDGTENDKECLVFMKGAVERVLDRCEAIGLGNDSVPLDETRKAEIIARMDAVSRINVHRKLSSAHNNLCRSLAGSRGSASVVPLGQSRQPVARSGQKHPTRRVGTRPPLPRSRWNL